MYSLEKTLKLFPNNFVPIWYALRYRGNAVNRIISAHLECVWNKKWNNTFDESVNSPLEFPNSFDSFNGDWSQYSRIGGMKASYGWVHTNSGLHNFSDRGDIENLLQSNEPDKYVVFHSHIPENKTLMTIKKYNIYLYCSDPSLVDNRPFKKKDLNYINKPFENDSVLSIDIAKLFSTDYEIFLNEYLKIVYYLDLTIRINSVRAFILRYNEREKFIANF